MNDWFIWNGRRCTEFGIHVSEQPPITLPKERVSQVTVPGRPGTLAVTEGEDVFDNMTLTATCFLTGPTQIPQIAAWLRGTGKVTFANRQGGFYYARIADQIAFDRILRGNPQLSFAVSFLCAPFWYPEDIADIEITEQGTILNNPGTVFSEPVITVYGSGSINLMVNDATVYLENVDGSITVDCEAGIAYTTDNSGGKTFAGEQVSLEEGVWPKLLPQGNANLITWEAVGNGSSVSRIVIRPNWRFL